MPHPPERSIRVAKKREYVDEYKRNTKCARCHQSFHPVCMDFHHKDDRRGGDEGRLIRKMVNSDYSIKRINEEIEKCVCLCSNCHRLLHYEEEMVL